MDLAQLTLADIRKMHPRERRGLFEDLVVGHSSLLLSRAVSVLHDEQLAQDICQEAWLLLHRHVLPSLGAPLLNASAPVGPIIPWLQGVVRKLALMELRKVNTDRKRLLEMRPDLVADDQDAQGPSSDLREKVEQALVTLTGKQRQVVLLRSSEGLSFGAIAGVLGISPGAARKLFFRALKKLQAFLWAAG